MGKVAVSRNVARKLSGAEAAIDAAIPEICRLIEGLITARAALRVSTTVGAEAGERLAAALTALMRARGEMAAAHGELAQVQAQLGLRRLNLAFDLVGPLEKPPPRTGRLGDEVPDRNRRRCGRSNGPGQHPIPHRISLARP